MPAAPQRHDAQSRDPSHRSKDNCPVAIPFTRSMRALHADSHLFTLISLSVAILLLIAWACWFLMPYIALKETGQIVNITRDGSILATFPPTAWGTIRRGQRALVRPQSDTTGARSNPIPAVVAEVTQQGRADQVQVELYVRTTEATARWLPPHGLHGHVEIIVAHASPATLIMRRWHAP
jgi:hypothetical protein